MSTRTVFAWSHEICPTRSIHFNPSHVFMSADSVCTADVSMNGMADASAE